MGMHSRESVVKAIGKSPSLPLRSVDANLEEETFVTSHEGVDYLTRDITELAPLYAAALTTASGPMPREGS